MPGDSLWCYYLTIYIDTVFFPAISWVSIFRFFQCYRWQSCDVQSIKVSEIVHYFDYKYHIAWVRKSLRFTSECCSRLCCITSGVSSLNESEDQKKQMDTGEKITRPGLTSCVYNLLQSTTTSSTVFTKITVFFF